jgi:cellulose synthase/poly-beta-1,6-N-acetylglucosamine synthase-like glycosyltransferase
MMLMTFIGILVIAAIIMIGAYWIMNNVTIKNSEPRYTYHKDKDGNEYVKDAEDESNDKT